ncbi:MAG: hypothetical protein R2832_19720 [Rhodothermales bacterium]
MKKPLELYRQYRFEGLPIQGTLRNEPVGQAPAGGPDRLAFRFEAAELPSGYYLVVAESGGVLAKSSLLVSR